MARATVVKSSARLELSFTNITAPLIFDCARRCIDEAALPAALAEGRIAGAAIDVTAEEPLAAASPLWDLPNLLITPHTAGETRRYEDHVLDILQDNLDRLWRGETTLRNQVV